MINFHQDFLVLAPDPTFTDREAQTIATASILSLLTYSNDPIGEMHQRTAQHSDDPYGIPTITQLWPLLGTYSGTLIAWSAPLNTCFIAFRGSSDKYDWLNVNFRTTRTFDVYNNWGVHKGFQSCVEGLPLPFISLLIRSYRTVICGHSLGGARATIAGLAISPQVLGNERRDAWSNASDATSQMSIVTFGAPSVMLKKDGQRAEPSLRLRALFHNVIDPDDVVPTIYNRAKEAIPGFSVLEAFNESLGGPGAPQTVAQWTFRLIKLAFDLSTLDGNAHGAHIGDIILHTGQNSFIRMCERNKALCLDGLSRSMSLELANVETFINRHAMTSYTTKWTACSSRDHSEIWTAQNTQPAATLLDSVVPRIDDAISQATQNPGTQSIDLAITFNGAESFHALHTFSHAEMVFGGSTANSHAVRKADLNYFAGQSAVVRFSFGISGRVNSVLSLKTDELWRALFEATNFVTLIDIFGRPHQVKLESGVLCENLATTRHQSTPDLVKAAMLRALALQVAFVHDPQSTSQARLNPDIMPIVNLIDRAVRNADTKRFLEGLQGAFGSVQHTWKSALADNDSESVASPPLEHGQTLSSYIPEAASGRLRIALTALIIKALSDESSGRSSICPQLGDVSGAPLFSDLLLSYTRLDPTTGTPNVEIISNIRTAMVIIGLVMHTQLNVDVSAPKISKFTQILSYAPEWTVRLIPFPVAIGLGVFLLYDLVGMYNDPMRLGYDDLVIKTLGQFDSDQTMLGQLTEFTSRPERLMKKTFGFSNGRSISTPSAELELEPLADRSVDDIVTELRRHGSNWPSQIPPPHHLYRWIQYVALIGSLRTRSSLIPSIGAFGPVRSGKSQLLTTVFGLDKTTFNPGSNDRNRTLHFRTVNTGTTLISDAPGLDESDRRLHEASRLLIDLLDVIIVVISFSLVDAESGAKLIRTLAQLLERRNGQPVCILINRVDEIITDDVIDEPTPKELAEFLDNVNMKKESFVRQLRQALGGRNQLNIVSSAPHPDPNQSNRRFVRQATVALDEVVHVSCLLDFEQSKALAPKRDVLLMLRAELKGKGDDLWDCNNVRRWVHDACPEAMPNL